MARTTGDIACRITKGGARFEEDGRYHSVMAIALENNKSAAFAGNGYWNDPDMLVTGEHGLTQEEQKTHFALWCVMTAPLMLGDDPRHLTQAEKDIILNRDCLAIDQDPLEQGKRIKADGNGEIWAKRLSDGRTAVLLLNRNGAAAKSVAFSGKEVGLIGKLSAKDVYGKNDLGTLEPTFSRELPPHGCVLLLVSSAPGK
jgi:alpha-galactosidase